MNMTHAWSNSRRLTPDLLKLVSILLLGISIGIIATTYPPFIVLLGTAGFTIFAVMLYVSSHYRSKLATPDSLVLHVVTASKNSVLFYLFFLSFFLSITIPKSGKTISNIPVTTANIVIIFTLMCWLMKFVFFRKATFRIPLFNAIIFFIGYGIINLFIGFANKNPYKFMILDFVAFIGFIPVYFLVCSAIYTEKQIKMITSAIVISFVMVCTYGVLQPKLGFEKIAIAGITQQYDMSVYFGVGKWNIVEGGTQKVYSTFQNGNIFGNHLATFIPFLGGILIGLPSFRKKLLLTGIFLLSCYVLILTYSRGALTGTVAGILALAFISKKIRFKAIIVVVLIFSVFLVFWYQYSERPELARYDIRKVADDPNRFSAGRIERAQQVIAGFYKLPFPAQLFGLGFGGTLLTPVGWRFEYVDNLYLTILFKMGIIGLAALIVTLILFFSRLLKLRSRIPDLYIQGLVNGGIAGLIGSLVHNLADTLWLFPPLSANFWFLAGITMSIAVISSQRVESDEYMKKTPQKAQAIPSR